MDIQIWARDLPQMLGEVYEKVKAKLPDDPKTRIIDVVEWLGRVPTRYPRRVHISDVLARQRILASYEHEGIARICKAMERGHDLRMFLGESTKSIRNRRDEKPSRPSKNDLFFSDWGLLHFHLGADLENSGKRVFRTRRVLIAYLTENEAFLIDVVPHGKGFFDTWGHKSHLETLLRNWPATLEKYEINGITPARESPLSSEDHIKLRQGGVTTFVELQGRVFMAPGQGIMTDRSSMAALHKTAIIQDELDAGEKLFRSQYPQGDALLFVGKDAGVGYFIPEKNQALCVFPSRHADSRVTWFFSRLLEETEILKGIPDGAIWTATTTQP